MAISSPRIRFRFIERRGKPAEGAKAELTFILFALVVGLAVGSVLFLPFRANPLAAYARLFAYGFGSQTGIAFTLVKSVPLILVGLGTVVAWRAGVLYLGFEGAVFIGGTTAVWIGLLCKEGGLIGPISPLLFWVLDLFVVFLVGGAWAALVALLQGRLGGNTVLISLMSNYIAKYLVSYLLCGPLRAPGDLPQTEYVPAFGRFPILLSGTRLHAGVFVAVLAVVAVYVLMSKTVRGYQLIVTGANPRAAGYSGINVVRTVIFAGFVAGGLGALAGGVEVLGVVYRMTEGTGQQLGWLGMITAVLGQLNPIGTTVASILYAGLGVGAEAMQRHSGVPVAVTATVQALIVVVMLSMTFWRRYKINWPHLRTGGTVKGIKEASE